jgi:hypothetical protein
MISHGFVAAPIGRTYAERSTRSVNSPGTYRNLTGTAFPVPTRAPPVGASGRAFRLLFNCTSERL